MEIKRSSILHITIYKPPQNCFIDDFTELLSIVCTAFDCLVKTGDLNVHVDVAQDKHAKELISVLEMFGLTQHVTKPTHSRGHGSAVVRGRPMNDSTGTQSMEMIKFENTLCSNVDSIQFNSIQFIYIAPNYNNCHLKAL